MRGASRTTPERSPFPLSAISSIKMGQTIATPLSLTLDHWRDVQIRANNLSMEIKRRKLQTLCTSEWPSFNVGWPKEGTFNITILLQVKEQIFSRGPQGHPDQVPYIVVWENLVEDPPSLGFSFHSSKAQTPSGFYPFPNTFHSPCSPLACRSSQVSYFFQLIPCNR